MGTTYKSRVYTDRPDYADFDTPAKFLAIQSIIAKRLQQHPKAICSYSGGPDGEMSASLRYLNQRYAAPYGEVRGLLTDIGREASEMVFSEASAFFSVSKAPVTPFATVKLHL